MNWLDYREKLGIAYCDSDKQNYFFTKIFNYLNTTKIGVTRREYMDFCDVTGTTIVPDFTSDYYSGERYDHFLSVLRNQRNSLPEFFCYYIALMNIKRQSGRNHEYTFLLNLIKGVLTDSNISFELIEDADGLFLFPKGAKELDDALVSQPLQWLSEYPIAHMAFVKALKEYTDATFENASEVADKFRKALEAFFQEFFSYDKTLENCKSLYGNYLKDRGVPKEISANLETLLQTYTTFMNAYAKHHDKTSVNILEYIMYQTGNIIRLLITLKQEETRNAD